MNEEPSTLPTPAHEMRALIEEGLTSGDGEILDEERIAVLHERVFGSAD